MGPLPVSPLDTLLTLMRWHWEAKEKAKAMALAGVAAPFVHPRAQAPSAPIYLAEAADDKLDLKHPTGRADAAT